MSKLLLTLQLTIKALPKLTSVEIDDFDQIVNSICKNLLKKLTKALNNIMDLDLIRHCLPKTQALLKFVM